MSPPTRPATFQQYTSTYPFSDLLSNYPSSVRCPTKRPSSWLPFINNVEQVLFTRLHFTLLFTKNFKQLQWGFQLTHNLLFCEHILSEDQPGNTTSSQHSPTKQITTLIFACILHAYPLLDLLIKTNCLYRFDHNLSRTTNTRFDHQPPKDTKSNN